MAISVSTHGGSRRTGSNLYFKTEDPDNHTTISGTYPFRSNRGVPPGVTPLLKLAN